MLNYRMGSVDEYEAHETERRRKINAARAKRWRAQRAEASMPDPREVDAAIAEAVAYLTVEWIGRSIDREEIVSNPPVMTLQQIFLCAMSIFVKRKRIPPQAAITAFLNRIEERYEWSTPGASLSFVDNDVLWQGINVVRPTRDEA